MSSSSLNIIIVAHPDDESLFFASLPLSRPSEEFWVVCVTDANADGLGLQRKSQFEDACNRLGVKRSFWLNFPDVYENRLDTAALMRSLAKMEKDESKYLANKTLNVFTHGPLGEYMHPHHQDVCFAVHKYFKERLTVQSPAYNCYPETTVMLSESQFILKTEILTKIYGSETNRFANLIPATWAEGFCSTRFQEIEEIYHYLSGAKTTLEPSNLVRFQWMTGFIEKKGLEDGKRLF
ncbi:PIG-L family deacetylase [bacterium]|nr:PIG-L family deacetylase [bacterium]